MKRADSLKWSPPYHCLERSVVYTRIITMLANGDLSNLTTSSFIEFDSMWHVVAFWFFFSAVYHITWVYSHSKTREEFFYNLPCKMRHAFNALQDYIEDMHEKKINGSCAFFVCPKRRQRFQMCARRCERRRRRNRADDDGEEQSEEMPCPLQACANFYRLHLPAPLPFVRRRRHKVSQKQSYASSSTGIYPTSSMPSVDKRTSPDVSQERRRILSKLDASSTLASSFSSSLASSFSSQLTERSTNMSDASRSRTSPIARSSLMDLARMQQWKAIMEQRLQLLSRRQAKYHDVDGLYPLHWACSGGPPVSVIQALLECYPSAARKADKEGSLPLHFATHYGASAPVVAALLSVYPDAIHVQDQYGRTPLYHAVDKSASIEVIQMLTRADPSMITTPCLPVNIRSQISLDQQHGLLVPRVIALRTPLFLAWASVLADQRSRDTCRGKIWDKAQLLLKTTLEYFAEHEPDITKPYRFITAAIVLDRFLPEGVVPLAIEICPDQLQIPDPRTRQLPLTIAAAVEHYSSRRCQQVLECLLQAYPQAAEARNRLGQSALAVAIASGKTWRRDGLGELFGAAPDAAWWRDQVTGLPPALLAATQEEHADSSRAFIISANVNEMNNSKKGPDLSALLETSDPYHLLTRKHHEQLKRRRQRFLSKLPNESTSETVDRDLLQLETIFELLQADSSVARRTIY